MIVNASIAPAPARNTPDLEIAVADLDERGVTVVEHPTHGAKDVDFVWRLIAAGWRVAYDPVATVRHAHRLRPAAFLAPAVGVRPLDRSARSPPPSCAAGLARRAVERRDPHPFPAAAPGAGALLAGLRLAVLRRRLARGAPHPPLLAAELLALALLGTARGASHAIRRTWSPLLIPAAARSRTARTALFAATVFALVDDQGRARHLPMALADDTVAALGTWAGCLSARTSRPLWPARPGPSRRA